MPTARQHTIILHGGSRGAKTTKTDLALKHYREVLENRVKCIMAETAKAVYNWQVPGTSIVKDERPRWSGAFRADWHVKIGDSGSWAESVAIPDRYPWNPADELEGNNHAGQYTGMIDLARAAKVLDGAEWRAASVDTPIYIGNVSPYAHWLNYGGEPDYDPNTFLRVSPGYQFIAKCVAALWEGNKKYQFVPKGLAAAAKKPARG